MATRKRTSPFPRFSFFTFVLVLLVVAETLWLAAFIYSEGTPVPAAISAAFWGGHKKEKPSATSLKYSDGVSASQKEKKDTAALPKHKSETPVAAATPAKSAQPVAAATPTPTPAASAAKKSPEGKIATKDDAEIQSLLTREGSKGKSAASGEGL